MPSQKKKEQFYTTALQSYNGIGKFKHMHRRHTSPYVKIFNDLLIVGHAWADASFLYHLRFHQREVPKDDTKQRKNQKEEGKALS